MQQAAYDRWALCCWSVRGWPAGAACRCSHPRQVAPHPGLGPLPLPLPAAKCRQLPLILLTSADCCSPHAPSSLPAAHRMPPACLPACPPAGKIWEFLRSELEMDGRFKTLESKLNLIQDNLKVLVAWQACAWAGQLARTACRRRVQRTMHSQLAWQLPAPLAANTRPAAPTRKSCCLCWLAFLLPPQYFLEILQNRKSDTLEWIISKAALGAGFKHSGRS